MSYHGTGQQRNQRVLHVQLTDETDALMLYNPEISEDDFHTLKTEQSILVDFPTFPSKFIELLRQCQSAAAEEQPAVRGVPVDDDGRADPPIIETNPFRQIAHLALRFVAGNDASIKKHLALRLGDYKSQLAVVRDELGDRTAQLQETAERGKRRPSASARSRRTTRAPSTRLRLPGVAGGDKGGADPQTAGAVTHGRPGAQPRRRAIGDGALVRPAVPRKGLRRVGVVDLRPPRARIEAPRETRASRARSRRWPSSRRRARRCATRTRSSLRRSTASRRTCRRDVELSAALQSAKDKEANLSKTAKLHEAANDAKRQLEDSLNVFKENNSKLQEKLRVSGAEITKGNAIINKLQNDGRALSRS